jgi:hypothetical protein
MVLCKWCGVRPAREAELKWGHRRCSQCRRARHQAKYDVWDAAYRRRSPTLKARQAEQARVYGKRKVKVAGRYILFPTVELKEQAVNLIRQRRYEFVTRLPSGAQAEGTA